MSTWETYATLSYLACDQLLDVLCMFGWNTRTFNQTWSSFFRNQLSTKTLILCNGLVRFWVSLPVREQVLCDVLLSILKMRASVYNSILRRDEAWKMWEIRIFTSCVTCWYSSLTLSYLFITTFILLSCCLYNMIKLFCCGSGVIQNFKCLQIIFLKVGDAYLSLCDHFF